MKPRLRYIDHALMAFATPIRQVVYDNLQLFNAELAKRILALRAESPGRKKSNVGGWQSEPEVLATIGEPYGNQLGYMFLENVKATMNTIVELDTPLPAKVAIEAWANVNERGDSNSVHIHPGSIWSGVYYAATDLNAGGEISFLDPRPAALMVDSPLNVFSSQHNITINPTPGMMFIFPSFLYHAVLPYEGNSPRISIAFNI